MDLSDFCLLGPLLLLGVARHAYCWIGSSTFGRSWFAHYANSPIVEGIAHLEWWIPTVFLGSVASAGKWSAGGFQCITFAILSRPHGLKQGLMSVAASCFLNPESMTDFTLRCLLEIILVMSSMGGVRDLLPGMSPSLGYCHSSPCGTRWTPRLNCRSFSFDRGGDSIWYETSAVLPLVVPQSRRDLNMYPSPLVSRKDFVLFRVLLTILLLQFWLQHSGVWSTDCCLIPS